jgi:hypothetical protein
MRLSKLAITFYVILVFGSGVAVGTFGFRLYSVSAANTNTTHNPAEWRKRYVSEMEGRLRLDKDQLRKLNGILDETRVRFSEVRDRMKPEFDRIKGEQVDKIRTILTDSQRQEYEKMRLEREQREKAQGGPHSGL